MREEMQFHMAEHTARNLRRGMTPIEAQRDTALRFGNVEHMKDNARDAFRIVWLEDAWRDTITGVRGLLRAPGFTLVAVVTLGLGIGAATTMYSVVDGVLLRSLPYPDADQLVRLYQLDSAGNRMPVSEPNFVDWQSRTRGFSVMAEMGVVGPVPVTGAFEPHMAPLTTVSRDFFTVMEVQPVLGRALLSADHREGAIPVALVSATYWERVLGGGSSLGTPVINANGESYRVVGVLGAGFSYPGTTQIWVPRELDPPQASRTAHNFAVIARRAPTVSLDDAQRELSTVSRAMRAQYSRDTWMANAVVVPLRDQLTAGARPMLRILFAASALLLVIACTNVSNLLVVRAAARQREVSLRMTLGAGRGRVVRQFLVETLLLCVGGAALGLTIAVGGVAAFIRGQPDSLPRSAEVAVDWRAFAFAVAVATVAAVALGVATAVRPVRAPLARTLAAGGRSAIGGAMPRRLRESLVVAQMALTLVLLAGAGVLARSFLQVLAVDPGYSTDDALVIDLTMPREGGDAELLQRVALQDAFARKLRALPGVTHVALINDFPLAGGWYANGMFIEMNAPDEIRSIADFGRLAAEGPARTAMAGFRVASEEYFDTMGIRLVAGRTFDASDGASADVQAAVISRSLAESRWHDRDPLGRYVQFGNMDGDMRALRVVGVVEDVREFGLENAPAPLLYVLNRQRPGAAARFSIVVRGPPPTAIGTAAQQIVRELAPDLPIGIRTVESAFDTALAGRRFNLLVIGAFAAVALVLAALGLYGVISFLTNQRRREIGIRVALGAQRPHIARLVAGQGAVLVALGIGIGLVVALSAMRVLSGLVFGVSAIDPVSLSVVVLVLACAAALATFAPLRRATRMTPATALRTD